MGLVATTPIYPEETANDSGPYGGDIYMEELVEGSTLFLPVFMPGTLLAMDDATPWSAMAQWPEPERSAPPAPTSVPPSNKLVDAGQYATVSCPLAPA